MTVSQSFNGRILLAFLETQDLDDVIDLFVVHQLRQRRLAHVEQFAAQRKAAVSVSNCQCTSNLTNAQNDATNSDRYVSAPTTEIPAYVSGANRALR
jgi:hypothetical protein